MTPVPAERVLPAWRGVAGNVLAGVLLIVAAGLLLRWQLQPIAWSDPGRSRVAAAVAVVLAYAAAVAFAGWRRTSRRRAAGRAVAHGDDVLVVHASQTGHAAQLAAQTAGALRDGGLRVRELEIGALDVSTLATAARVLFVVATTGEGDAPDAAAGFQRRVMAVAPSLPRLRYGVLALGDRDYDNFCAFGRRLDHWLHRQGAAPLFDRIDVDNGDPGALRHWQHHLRQLTGVGELPDWEAPQYSLWTLRRLRLPNPGSAGGPCFHVELAPPAGTSPAWQAGDIAEIGPRQAPADVAALLAAGGHDGTVPVRWQDEATTLADALASAHLPPPGAFAGLAAQAVADALVPLPHREYSIASLPADGAMHLLVRRMTAADGRPGLGSGWLCQHAGTGATIAVRVRRNVGFHPPADDRPLLLVGNGTGLAGLRALLKARIAAGHRRNWLLFGERNAAVDDFHGAELADWREQGWIERLDRVWSRDGGETRYVQDRLREQAARVREWVDAGAAIYVCGSLVGMAPGVDAALAGILGAEILEGLAESGRYRRDVY